MVVYSCPRCGFTNNIKTKMRSHFMRKNICSPSCLDIPIEECYKEVLGEKYENALKCVGNALECVDKNLYKCDGCKKKFKHPRYLKQHISRYNCKNKAFTKEEVAEEVAEKVAEANAQNAAVIAESAAVIAELKTQNANLLQKVGNNNTTNNNTINIHLKAFGQENLSYITPEFIKDLIRYNLFSAIPKLLKEIHFNPDHTENRNTLVPSRKDTLAKTYNGDKWNFTTKDEVFEDMTDKAFNKLTEYGSGPKFEKFYDAYDDQDTGYLKKIKKQTEIMILNNQ